MGRCKKLAKKVLKYAPPFITQVVTFAATRALENEYQDYGGDDFTTPLVAKGALVAITIISSITALYAAAMGWGVENASKFVRRGEIVINVVALIIAIVSASVMLQSHETLKDAGRTPRVHRDPDITLQAYH